MKYLFLIASIILSTVICLISFFGGFEVANKLLYDQYVRSCDHARQSPSHVFLIEMNQKSRFQDNNSWHVLLQNIQKLNPRKIILMELPQDSSDLLNQLAQYDNTVVATRVIETKDQSYDFSPSLDILQKLNINYAIKSIPHSFHGVNRYQTTHLTLNGITYQTIEYMLVEKDNINRQIQNDSYLIDFRGKENGLAKLDFQRAVAGELISQMITNKYVIIGSSRTIDKNSIKTTITPHQGMPESHFHAYALETLLGGNIITEVSAWIELILLFCLCLFNLIFYQYISFRLITWISLPFTLFYIIITWLLLAYMNLWLPLIEILAANFISIYLVYRKRSLQQEDANQKLVIDASVKLRERYIPESFFESSEHWSQVINMVNQALDLNRSIFLERVKGDHRVREVIALNCDINDIDEQRRDYERTPYSTAISQGTMIQLDKRKYLTINDTNETQYLVALIFGGIVQGFWAFGISPENQEKIDNFQEIIMAFSGQIAELLFRREQKLSIKQMNEREVYKILKMEGAGSAYNELNSSITMLGRRLDLMEHVFHSIDMAVILYDMFGRLVHINQPMISLLKQSDVLPFEMTAMDLCVGLTNQPIEKIRQLFREMIFWQNAFTFSISFKNHQEKKFILKLKPMTSDENIQEFQDTNQFQTYGFILEIIETTELGKASQLKGDFLNYFNFKLSRDLQNIPLALSVLLEKRAKKDHKKNAVKIINQRLRDLFKFINEAPEEFGRNYSQIYQEQYPLMPSKMLSQASLSLTPLAKQKRVTLKTNIPELATLVCTKPELLEKALSIITETLIEDAKEGTTLMTDLIETDEQAILTFVNDGYGLPNEDLQEFIFGTNEIQSKTYQSLRKIAREIKDADWVIQARSEIGSGMNFSIILDTKACVMEI